MIRQHELKDNQEAWTCDSCGIYERKNNSCLNQVLRNSGQFGQSQPEKAQSLNVKKVGQIPV